MRSVLAGCVMFGSLCASLRAHATPWEPKTDAAIAAMTRGRQAFEARDYDGAAAAFLAAWDAEHTLTARWSAAQAYAAGGDWPRAKTLLDALVADPTWPAAKRADLEARARVASAFVNAANLARDGATVRARDAYLAIEADTSAGANAREQAKKAADALADKLAQPAPVPVEVQPKPLELHGDQAAVPPPTASPGRDWIGWSAVGAGAAFAIAGGALTWHAGTLYEDADQEPDEQANQDLRDRADTQRIGGHIALGVGAALVVVGAVKLIAFKASPRSPSVALAPRDGGGVLVVGGRF